MTTMRGERELTARFETITPKLREAIKARMQGIGKSLQARIQELAPYKTGLLRSEITLRVFDDAKNRVAAYVGVYAPQNPTREYPKAATLEYGSKKARKFRAEVFSARLGRMTKRGMVERMTRPVTIQARRYLRGGLASMEGEINAEIDAAIAEVVAE
jgi:hypothetical protein